MISYADIAIILMLLISFYLGYRQGLILTLLMLLAFMGAILATVYCTTAVLDMLATLGYGASGKSVWMAYLITFLGAFLLVYILGVMLKKLLDTVVLGKVTDALAGALFACLKWWIGMSFVAHLCTYSGVVKSKDWYKTSVCIPILNSSYEGVLWLYSTVLPDVDVWLKDLDSHLKKD